MVPTADSDEYRLREAQHLGDLVNGHPEHVDNALPQLLAMLTATEDPAVTRAVVDALRHAWHPAASAAVLNHVPVDHPDAGVRLAVAQALPGGVDEPGILFDRAVNALTRLTRDEEPRVRDWAAFGLGQLEARTPQVLDALAALLGDTDDEARCEALVALAAAGDERALPVLRRSLESDEGVFRLELVAAVALAAPELHAALQLLVEGWAGDEDELSDLARTAVARTAPGAARAAQQVEQDLLEQVRRLAPTARAALTGAYPRTVLVITDEDEELDVPLWADCEEPDDYPTGDVLNAVRFTFPQPAA